MSNWLLLINISAEAYVLYLGWYNMLVSQTKKEKKRKEKKRKAEQVPVRIVW
jgi:hypothetical protein